MAKARSIPECNELLALQKGVMAISDCIEAFAKSRSFSDKEFTDLYQKHTTVVNILDLPGFRWPFYIVWEQKKAEIAGTSDHEVWLSRMSSKSMKAAGLQPDAILENQVQLVSMKVVSILKQQDANVVTSQFRLAFSNRIFTTVIEDSVAEFCEALGLIADRDNFDDLNELVDALDASFPVICSTDGHFDSLNHGFVEWHAGRVFKSACKLCLEEGKKMKTKKQELDRACLALEQSIPKSCIEYTAGDFLFDPTQDLRATGDLLDPTATLAAGFSFDVANLREFPRQLLDEASNRAKSVFRAFTNILFMKWCVAFRGLLKRECTTGSFVEFMSHPQTQGCMYFAKLSIQVEKKVAQIVGQDCHCVIGVNIFAKLWAWVTSAFNILQVPVDNKEEHVKSVLELVASKKGLLQDSSSDARGARSRLHRRMV